MPTKQKAEIIEKIKHEFSNAEAVYLVDYKALTVKQAEALRAELRGVNAEMKVYKNTLARIALSELDMPTMDDLLVDGCANATRKAAISFERGDAAMASDVVFGELVKLERRHTRHAPLPHFAQHSRR